MSAVMSVNCDNAWRYKGTGSVDDGESVGESVLSGVEGPASVRVAAVGTALSAATWATVEAVTVAAGPEEGWPDSGEGWSTVDAVAVPEGGASAVGVNDVVAGRAGVAMDTDSPANVRELFTWVCSFFFVCPV